ncbi:5-formyltetrahydrofolate cyclo-ligase [Chitinibacter bivalviorum]|uniref:5-formyltetrahydrofolate cyclo-ligase n=1 Tax=Chitinibacter bivalviorum TaxID=2739434 RepID=A0A7H9BLD6_9NEIS|nr:5-formyltetrahydrofolate cyclo-ligase [Chitinibacter bivalviorum]QLG89212.1 5-formyltetrahydrofolate cyclo-ligase [Chitinibacter bivalviorum]
MLQSNPPTNPELRRQLRQARLAISPVDRLASAWSITRSQPILNRLRRGKKIALYVPVGGEFPTWPLILTALHRGCQVFLPQTPQRGRQLRFVRLDARSSWSLGKFNIPVPNHTEQCRPKDLDTVFVPLLGFDHQLARMGQGGGYYDSTFAFRRLRRTWQQPKLIGLAFQIQQVANLPVNTWDLRLDALQTECNYLHPALHQT